MAKVVGVKFKDAGKLYYFSPAKIDVKMGDNVIVETAQRAGIRQDRHGCDGGEGF